MVSQTEALGHPQPNPRGGGAATQPRRDKAHVRKVLREVRRLPDSDISPDQLSALSSGLDDGLGAICRFLAVRAVRPTPPQKADLHRLLPVYTATGEWQKKEQPGHADCHTWHQCFKVYRTGMLLLEAADAERLDAYGEHIRGQVTQFSEDAWWLIARADQRLRSEHLERIESSGPNRPSALRS